jgi:serine phosphatase RsbU (regulator of sigma subunit)
MTFAALGGLLTALDRSFPTRVVEVVADYVRSEAGAEDVAVLIADYDLRSLRPLLPSGHKELGASIPVDGTEAGQAFITQSAVTASSSGHTTLFVPISVRADRLGVLQVRLRTAHPDTLSGLLDAATGLGYVLMLAHQYTDVVERARRERPLELPAELQWGQLPVRAFDSAEFALAGQLVPAYEVGGDLFDYAVEPDELFVTVTDAMGHGLSASLLGGLAVNALRNARRTGLSLADTVRFADRVLYGQFGGDQFVTVLTARLDLASGRMRFVQAGHPPFYLLRAGAVTRVDCDAQLPVGMFEATRYAEQECQLRPGDRVVMISDGVVEAVDTNGVEFGEQRLEGTLLATRQLSAGEMVRQTMASLSDYQRSEPRDDATVLCLDWHGPHA